MEVIITEQNFAEYSSKSELLVLDFWATWCGPCRALAPTLSDLAKEYDGKIIVGKVDVDQCEDLAEKYGIRNVPTMIFLKNGEIADKAVGALAKPALKEKIDALL